MNAPLRIDAEIARQLVAQAAPDLAQARLDLLGEGWDHHVYSCGGRVFRFPRTEQAVRSLSLEASLLPWLAARLPLAMPVPALLEATHDGHVVHFSAHSFLPGRTVADADLDDGARAALAAPLGRFVRALHDLAPGDAPTPLEGDPLGRLDRGARTEHTSRLLAALVRDGVVPRAALKPLAHRLRDDPAAPPTTPLVIAHGDLHPRNLLCQGPALTGVLDWVDVHLGHREVDLAAMYVTLPPSAHDAFLAAYGDVTPQQLAWARFRAVDHTVRALSGSLKSADLAMVKSCRRALLEQADP